ncbi:hypothetical protein ACPF8X_03730 [Streptomyces sp. G35A]
MTAPPAIGDLTIGDLPADPRADAGRLHRLAGALRAERPRVLGFPGNLDFALEDLAPLLNALVNNVGDPYCPDASNIGAKAYEVAVLEYFAQLAGALPGEVYGYVASSSSEALLHGLATARRRLPRACVYACDEAHYSVRRACELLRMELVTMASLPDGRTDPKDLRLRLLQRRGRSRQGAVVLATCGTTMASSRCGRRPGRLGRCMCTWTRRVTGWSPRTPGPSRPGPSRTAPTRSTSPGTRCWGCRYRPVCRWCGANCCPTRWAESTSGRAIGHWPARTAAWPACCCGRGCAP